MLHDNLNNNIMTYASNVNMDMKALRKGHKFFPYVVIFMLLCCYCVIILGCSQFKSDDIKSLCHHVTGVDWLTVGD